MSKAAPSVSRSFADRLLARLLASGSERSVNCRHTEVLERIAGSPARCSIQSCVSNPSVECGEIGVGPGNQRVETADPLRPLEREQPILDAQHRRRVDGFAAENSIDQLAAFGQAKNLGQGARRRFALQALDCARAQNDHAVRRFAAKRLLPAERADIDLLPVDLLGKRCRGCIADRKAASVGGDPVGVRYPDAARCPVPGENDIARQDRYSESRAIFP